MAPTRKGRNVNKRFPHMSKVSPTKDGEGVNRNSPRKRKLSDILGPQWSKEELSSFYEAYRKYGKDWKKVASAVRNRTSDMVEGLYSMNRAYLSLPEGTASVVGLKAMMTDYYCNLQLGSESEEESNEGAGTSRKPQKRAKGKFQGSTSKVSEGSFLSPPHSQSVASDDCLSFLKRKSSQGNKPRAVGKRTPRFPVSHYENFNGDKYFSSTRQGLKMKGNVNDDEVAHDIALTLAEANKTRESVLSSPIRKRETKYSGEDDTRYRAYQMKHRRYNGKKVQVDDNIENYSEACSGTEENQRLGAHNTDVNTSRSPLQVSRKRTKNLILTKDDEFLVDALQALADVSISLSRTEDDESMMQVNDESDDQVDESGSQEAMPRTDLKDNRKSSFVKLKANRDISRSEIVSPKTLKIGKVSYRGDRAEFDGKLETNQFTSKGIRKKPKIWENDQSESQEVEARDAGKKSMSKMKRALPTLVENHEDSSSNDPPTLQISVSNQENLPTKVRSRRKMKLMKPQAHKDLTNPINAPLSSLHNKTFSLKEMVSSCLSNDGVRRWCIFEWFYSAIDYPWFAKKEFVEYLYHVRLGHVPRLTRVEWGVIRSSLGKPRRFSSQFLKEEKKKLNLYRDSVRKHYSELRDGSRDGLPTDLARPLSVGQRVIALHPKTREIHDGSVLTVDRSRCRVQFDRPELGVEFVTDIDCMPLNAFENMPTSLARHNYIVGVDNKQVRPGDLQLSPSGYGIGVFTQTKVDPKIQARVGIGSTEAATYHAKEVDVQALAELTRALDKKEAVVSELRHMNDDVNESQKVGNSSLKESEAFKKQYAAVLVQLNEANEHVSSALNNLRQRNTYQGHAATTTNTTSTTTMTCPRPNSNSNSTSNFIDTQPQESSGSHVNEIIVSSKTKAQTMVDAAMQAMSTFKADEKGVEAIDYVNYRLPLPLDDTLDSKPNTASDEGQGQGQGQLPEIPSQLITQCIATLFMIQKCTQRQFPPADVAQILDSAVMGLQPCCSQNLPFYAEVQKCMGIIRNQILALVPT